MSTYSMLYDSALLAHAAYLNFSAVSEPGGVLAGKALETVLTNRPSPTC